MSHMRRSGVGLPMVRGQRNPFPELPELDVRYLLDSGPSLCLVLLRSQYTDCAAVPPLCTSQYSCESCVSTYKHMNCSWCLDKNGYWSCKYGSQCTAPSTGV